MSDLLVTPLISGGERLGLLCAGAPPRRPFTGEDTEMARAVAHLAAIAIKRAELIEGLTNANIVKDLFEALGDGRRPRSRRPRPPRCAATSRGPT